jgi:magnesium chelatase family protein
MVASVAGEIEGGALTNRRPFRAPHHSASMPALVGGGLHARPGEISLAHHGVLFLDELPEFSRAVLEALREPLETGVIAVARAALQVEYPAEFQLVAAMNPCPCGRLGERGADCRCTRAAIRRYRARISAPLLDRIDLQVEVPRVPAEEFVDTGGGLSSAAAASAVAAARALQDSRQGRCNARLADAVLERWCPTASAAAEVLDAAVTRWELSARARARVLKVARTIADLAGAPQIGVAHVSEALLLRCLDRERMVGATAPASPCSRRPA